MAQKYLPEVRSGDKRIVLVDGEFLCAVLRVPAPDDARGNLHVGARPMPTTLDDRDRAIIDQLGPYLRECGFFLVGLDVIGGWLTEINVTSPTGILEANSAVQRPLRDQRAREAGSQGGRQPLNCPLLRRATGRRASDGGPAGGRPRPKRPAQMTARRR